MDKCEFLFAFLLLDGFCPPAPSSIVRIAFEGVRTAARPPMRAAPLRVPIMLEAVE